MPAVRTGTRLPQFIPILSSFTARVAGCGYDEMMKSPALLARATAETQQIIGHDGVLFLFDPIMLVNDCLESRESSERPAQLREPDEVTRSGGFATILESIPPLRHRLPASTTIFASFSGPGLLLSELESRVATVEEGQGMDPDYICDVIVRAARASLEGKADGLAMIERISPTTPTDVLALHRTVRKLADFYDSAVLLFALPGSCASDHLAEAHCIFNLEKEAFQGDLIQGQVNGPHQTAIKPMTTAGDVPASTPVETVRSLREHVELANRP